MPTSFSKFYSGTLASCFCALFILSSCSFKGVKNSKIYYNPGKIRFTYSDIDNFWKAYDKSAGKADSIMFKIYNQVYFANGSIGLKDFDLVQDLNRKQFLKNINQAHNYFDASRSNSLHVSKYQPAILAALYRLKKIYPNARFPNIYFIITGFKSGGTVSNRAIIIGTEFWCLPENRKNNFDLPFSWMKDVVRKPDNIPFAVAHEIVHFQRNRYELPHSLLGKCLAEGSADFVGRLISGSVNNKYLYDYAITQEKVLWQEFKKDMRNNDLSRWIYNLGAIKDRPADLGYFIGYKICESYYQRIRDKRKAVKNILEMKDFEKFLVMSKYDEKFK